MTTTMNPATQPRWKPSWLTWMVVACGVLGLLVILYPTAAAWVTQFNQSKVTQSYANMVDRSNPDARQQLKQAHEYNDALSSGVELEANGNVPVGTGTSSDSAIDYNQTLSVDGTGLMARLLIPSIDVDLPIYHGTDDETLLQGVGHLEGSHLPIGGEGTQSVLTAHRGLASATMFSDLDKVVKGDSLTVQVFGEVLTYRVTNTRVVAPEDTDSLRPVAGKDLMTLITCTPVGINTHRILVTAERTTPTPVAELDRAHAAPSVPGFPWWAVIAAGVFSIIGLYLWRAGRTDARLLAARAEAGNA